VHWRATTRKVLTSEWVEGRQLAKSSKEEINRLVPLGVKCFLVQLLDLGFFHSDPHPGNLLVDEAGRLVLIDFGLCAEISRPSADGMTAAVVHLMGADVPSLVADAVQLGFLPADVDRAALLPKLQAVFDEARLAAKKEAKGQVGGGANKRRGQAEGGGGEAEEWLPAKRRRQFREVSGELNQIFFDFPFTVPSYFALITRALIVLEGIAVSGDPSFDIFKAAYPYCRQRAVEVFGWRNVVAILGAAAAAASDDDDANSKTQDVDD
jgi:aarF domain-containing kinase